MLAPFVLRRLKSDVLKQLVAKNDSLEKVPLSKVRDKRDTAVVWHLRHLGILCVGLACEPFEFGWLRFGGIYEYGCRLMCRPSLRTFHFCLVASWRHLCRRYVGLALEIFKFSSLVARFSIKFFCLLPTRKLSTSSIHTPTDNSFFG